MPSTQDDLLNRWEEFCYRLSQGESVRTLAKDFGVHLGQVWRVSELTPETRVQYARARDAQAHALAQEAIDLADGCVGASSDVVQATRLQVDTRKWYTSKIAPRYYGDKLDVNVEVSRSLLTPEERDARLRALVGESVARALPAPGSDDTPV